MNSFVCFAASYLVNSIWEVALIGAAGWTVSRLLKRLEPRVEHIFWVATLALAMLMPALPLWRWLPSSFSVSNGIKGHSSIVLVAAEAGRSHTGAVALLSPALIFALLALYGIALLYFAGRLGTSLYLTIKVVREAYPLSLDPGKDRLWNRCQRTLCLRNVLVLGSEQVAGPVTVAFQKPVLLLPSGFTERCTDDDFLAALAHECAHLQRHDFQKNLLYEIAGLAIAFHPVTWMVKSKIAQTREMICDGMATEKLIDSHAYTQSLLRLAAMVSFRSRVALSNAIGIFDANILEERVMMMKRKRQHHSVFMRYGLILPAGLLMLSIAAGAGAMAVAIAPQTTSQPYGQVYKVGKDVSAPKLTSSALPEYPESARKAKGKFEGTCVIGLIVDSSGVPHEVHITRSLGPDFDASAIKAVQQYRFNPATLAGEPVAVALSVEVRFQKF